MKKPLSEALMVRRLYWTSFALRFAVGLLAWLLTEYAELPLMEDGKFYSEAAAEVAQEWVNDQESTWLVQARANPRMPWLMIYTLAAFYWLTGGVEVVPLAVGLYSLLTAFTPVLAYRAGRRLGVPADGALAGARLVAYSPAFAFWSSALYKEGLILLVLYFVIDHTLRLQQGFRPASVVILGFSLLALFGLRFYIAGILSIALLAGLVLGRGQKGAARGDPVVLRQAFVLVLLLSVASLLGLQDRVGELLSRDVTENLEYINSTRQALAQTDSGYLHDANVSNTEDAIRFLPIGLVYFLTVPLPWQWGSFRQNLAIPETLFWIVLIYPRVVIGIRRGASRNPQGILFLLLAAVAISCLYALFMGNIGTTYRVRIQIWAIFALFAGWGFSSSSSPVPGRRPAALQRASPSGPPSEALPAAVTGD